MVEKRSRKDETRRKMLDAAGQKFREYGYAGIGVDGVAKAAGATSGAFYAHFGSKDGAFDAAVEAGLDEVIAALPELQKESGAGWVEAFAHYYLGRAHRADLPCGCAMATLSPEVVRAGPETQVLYEGKMDKIAELAAHGLKGGSMADRRGRAWAMLSVLIGGLTVARGMKSRKMSDEIAAAVISAAIAAAGSVRG